MCELCHAESDTDYTGDSIEEKRRKATWSIIERHPELEISADNVCFRFTPESEQECVRVNLSEEGPRYEVHVPGSMGQAMAASPSIRGVAMIALLASNQTYEDICGILDINTHVKHNAFFFSEHPPIDPGRKGSRIAVDRYESEIRDSHTNSE